ncbi:unnamed protein product [Protopolystoma xenopodis]|uniref:Uncharacterized protein n=1 Tax=Protopolystoma xenopodis TaxID=117903 RepID=A0A448X3G9_9PLAT|nr:unnamed protein product [Protopolystoma xenopodis]
MKQVHRTIPTNFIHLWMPKAFVSSASTPATASMRCETESTMSPLPLTCTAVGELSSDEEAIGWSMASRGRSS